MNVQIKNLQKIFPIKINYLSLLVKEICSQMGIKRGVLSVVLTDNELIARLNKEYLEKKYSTDVLSFNLQDTFDPLNIFGEIIISVEEAENNSALFCKHISSEVLLYVIHGLLHLTGFNDSTYQEKKKMQKKENELLSMIEKRERRLVNNYIR